jgi:hypothetical protein
MTRRISGSVARWRPHGAGPHRRCAAAAAANAPGVSTVATEPAVFGSQTLQAGELVILLVRPSAWMFSSRALGATIIAGAAAGVLGMFGALSGALGPILLAWGALSMWCLADWRTRWYILTDRRVIAVRGLVRISAAEMPLTAVTRVRATDSRLLGVCGVGSVFSCAARDGGSVAWPMVRGPRALRDRIVEVVHRYGRRDAEAE